MAKKRRVLGNYAELGRLMHAQPFEPFDIKTADGDTFHVPHPDFVARSPGGDTAIAFDKDDVSRVINLRLVVSLEPSRPKGAGKARKR